MLRNEWDADLAVTFGPLEELLDGQPTIDRYGITVVEELAGEPLSVALAQEEPEAVPAPVGDGQWVLIDEQWDGDDRLFLPVDDRGPEEAAMHLVRL